MKYWAFAMIVLILACVLIADSPYGEATFAFVRAVPFGDKIGHFCLMGLLAFTVHRAFPQRKQMGPWLIPIGITVVIILVLGEEISQIWFDNRTFSFQDLTADALGIGLGGWLAEKRKASS